MKKEYNESEPREAEIIGRNPARDYKKSSNDNYETKNSKKRVRGQKVRRAKPIKDNTADAYVRIFRISKIVAVLIVILLICILGLILKFLVGVLAWLLQFFIVIAAVALVVWLIYSLIKSKK